MIKWIGYNFQSSCYKTPEFNQFAKDFRRAVKKQIKPEYELVQNNIGHFYISGFLQNIETKQLVYFSVSDVRDGGRSQWNSQILYRTADHDRDYTGGGNNYCSLENFNPQTFNKLLKIA